MKPLSKAWSASRLKAFLNCPRRFYEVQLAKRVSEPESDAMRHGTMFHMMMQKRLENKQPLQKGMERFDKLIRAIEQMPGKKWAEYKMALTEDRQPTEFFAPDVDVRAIADVLVVHKAAMLLVDYKTGTMRDDDLRQLDLTMAVAMECFPEVPVCHGMLAYSMTGSKVRSRLDRDGVDAVFMALRPLVDRLQAAVENEDFPPKPGYGCKHCLIRSCEHNPKHGQRDLHRV